MEKIQLDPKNTIVIADFDGTFTKKGIKGGRGSALMDLLRDEKYMDESSLKECRDLFDHYYPIEFDPYIDEKEKMLLMQEWWEKSFEVIKESGVTRDMLLEICHSPLLQWRDQLLDFLKLLQEKEIPLIIFSASGFGNLVIKYLLEKEDLFTSNVKIFSNEVVFDEKNFLLEMVQPIIHTSNKTGALLIKDNLLDASPERRHCLLIGDGLDDVKMAKGIDFDFTYKVAFGSNNLEHFKKVFDLVLPIDGSYKEIIDLFD
ncbi:MAG: hypothetical protein UT13_C0001G0758 [Candidatus Pacebacteria bacterium GW2011_GWF2_38_9]|nr:MAG: Cytosolic 5'-nucleotidase III, putative [candidate division TM6 bacterium GW2011_GWF2_28_16]KKQ89110.1 MAG: hypothetical protein UT13_C0001G0758 [Candidatus Pacebacteria bacterium GW2011_GWF2_38_9]HAZ73610.1 hypothetical protein [Candidatus Paceibacterota bacterium]